MEMRKRRISRYQNTRTPNLYVMNHDAQLEHVKHESDNSPATGHLMGWEMSMGKRGRLTSNSFPGIGQLKNVFSSALLPLVTLAKQRNW